MKIEAIYVSPGHNFFGRHGQPVEQHAIATVETVECVAGRGLRGDRFFDYKAGYAGQITFFSLEVHAALQAAFALPRLCASAYRRKVLIRGADLTGLIGRDFEIQGVVFRGVAECKPCYWMDGAVAPGAEAWLKGRGGLRAQILNDGWLHRKSGP
jgi:MOSC domain-containing protein YiiM